MSSVKFVGRRVSVGIGKETSRGVAVAATYWEKQTKVDVDDKITHLPDDSAFGVIEDASQGFLAEKWSEMTISGRVKASSFGLWFLSLFGKTTNGVYFPTFLRLNAGTITGTPQIGATLLQATSLATATVIAVADATHLDLKNILIGFDASHVVTGTNPDATTFTFTPGTALPVYVVAVGDTVTGGSSSATATVAAISPYNNYLIVTSPSGAFTTGEIITATSGGKATLGATDNGATSHLFQVNETNQSQSLTISTLDPVQGYRYANAMMEEMDLTMEIAKYFDFQNKVQAFAGATNSPTPSFTNETIFLPQHANLKVASDVYALAGSTPIKIKKFDIKFAKNLMRDFQFGSTTPVDILNQQWIVTGTIELLYENTADFEAAFIGDTLKAILLDVKNTDVTIGASSHPEVQLQLDNVKFTNYSRGIDNDKIVTQKVDFKGYYSLANASMVTALLTNLVSSY